MAQETIATAKMTIAGKPDAGRLAASARGSNRPNLATAKRSECMSKPKKTTLQLEMLIKEGAAKTKSLPKTRPPWSRHLKSLIESQSSRNRRGAAIRLPRRGELSNQQIGAILRGGRSKCPAVGRTFHARTFPSP
jgi:hypothetical protein